MNMRIPALGRLVVLTLAFVAGGALMAAGLAVTGYAQATVNGVYYPNLNPNATSNPDMMKALMAAQQSGGDVESLIKQLNVEIDKEDGKVTSDIDKAQQSMQGMTMTDAKPSDLMKGSKQCMEYQWVPTPRVCCKICHHHGNPYCCLFGDRFDINYWEASEIIEVSCRTGYSMINNGKVPTRGGGEVALQSCVGANRPGNSKWFFEARVWAINGSDGGIRHQGAGATEGEQMRQCTLQAGDDLPWPPLPGNVSQGYGIKWQDFSRGSGKGPSGSWEAYISDSDPEWAKDGSGSDIPDQGPCEPGSNSMANCWGPVSKNGWVSHPNPKVAAALVAWRAHEMAVAAKKVSPPGKKGGYQMAMEYPWLTYAGDYGASMGLPKGDKKGSGCFKPGDAGPEWYGGQKPDEIPAMIAKLNNGSVATVAEINPGIYIFTIWVYTSCTRYKIPTGIPTDMCHYEGKS